MSQNDWAAEVARVVGREIQRYRNRRGISAERLAQECTTAGLPMKRPVIANLELGRRPTVSLMELLVLGKVLGVPPLLLVFPVGREEMSEVLPDREVPTWLAAKWFTGEEAFPTRLAGQWVETPEAGADWRDGAAPVDRFRWNDRRWRDLRSAELQAKTHRERAESAETEAEREALIHAAEASERLAKSIEADIRRNREGMRRDGLTPGKLTAKSAHIDPEEGDA